ncbi:MAG: CDP-alcohol phosphatidyltransferase family protein [Bacteroidales bacterium]|nr:CDP-alcohol phosphatidyltransferase family protein [Bacteroidales bacterium]
MDKKEIAPSLESTLKSNDTEEWIDLIFYRPVGYQWALFFHKLGVTPNTITVLSIFLGIGAGILFYPQSLGLNVIGMILLIWANMYDSADGQLARMTGQKSNLGRILDGVSGDLWFISIYVAICLRLTPDWGWWIWLLAAFAGFSHSKQASLADYYRNIHLFFIKGREGSELSNSRKEKESYDHMKWSDGFLQKLFLWFYIRYTASQEKATPAFQRFFSCLKEKGMDSIPQSLKTDFRKASLPLMKYTNILSFNTRVFVLFISLFVNLPWIFFVFELTLLNILLIYMAYRHEKISRQFYEKLVAQD